MSFIALLQLAVVIGIPATVRRRAILARLRKPHVPRGPSTSLFAVAAVARLATALLAAALLPSAWPAAVSASSLSFAFDFDFAALALVLALSRAALLLASLDSGGSTHARHPHVTPLVDLAPALAVFAAFAPLVALSRESRMSSILSVSSPESAALALVLQLSCFMASVVLLAAAALEARTHSAAPPDKQYFDPGAESALLEIAGAAEQGILVFLGIQTSICALGFADFPAAPAISLISMLVFCCLFALLKLEPRRRSRYP